MALNLCFPLIPLSSTHSNLKRLPSPKPQIKKFTTTARASDRRSSEVYQPNIWDYHSLQSLLSNPNPMDESDNTQKIEALKKELRHTIVEEKEVVDHLELIDALRNLGVAYHFEEEIKVILGSMPVSSENVRMVLKDDLHSTALLFRLLREHGSFVSQDVFDSFKDEKGDFKVSLCDNTKGMLSLYEASYYSVKGEDTLDEARAFTTKHLQCLMEESLDPCVRENVAHALELPLNWRVPRLDARWFINVYERAKDSNPLLIEFAKREFNVVQGIYQTELKELMRWWTNLGFHENLSFARDRLIECFLVVIGWASEPRFWRFRDALTKFSVILTTIDDVYDVYGSMEELELFTDAVVRWDTDKIEQLPQYMKICYLALINSVNEAAYDVLKEKGLDITQHLKKTWGIQCNSYLKEAKWIHSQHIPTFEEYIDNGWISISAPSITTYSYYFVSNKITNEALECLMSCKNVVYHSSMILRLLNDLSTSTDEVNRGDVQKSIQCLMHERGVTEVVARENIMDMVRDLWKELNGYRFATPFEKPFLTTSINIARMAHYMYQHKDRFGKPDLEFKDHAMSLLIEPISPNV